MKYVNDNSPADGGAKCHYALMQLVHYCTKKWHKLYFDYSFKADCLN